MFYKCQQQPIIFVFIIDLMQSGRSETYLMCYPCLWWCLPEDIQRVLYGCYI